MVNKIAIQKVKNKLLSLNLICFTFIFVLAGCSSEERYSEHTSAENLILTNIQYEENGIVYDIDLSGRKVTNLDTNESATYNMTELVDWARSNFSDREVYKGRKAMKYSKMAVIYDYDGVASVVGPTAEEEEKLRSLINGMIKLDDDLPKNIIVAIVDDDEYMYIEYDVIAGITYAVIDGETIKFTGVDHNAIINYVNMAASDDNVQFIESTDTKFGISVYKNQSDNQKYYFSAVPDFADALIQAMINGTQEDVETNPNLVPIPNSGINN